MSDKELRAEIVRVEAELSRNGDDARASRRETLAVLHKRLGDRTMAAHWYLEAARHVASQGDALKAIAYAKSAVRVHPVNPAARAVYEEYWKKWGPEGPPDPV